jgi:hypothetical protein
MLHVVFTLHVSSCMSRRGTLSATWPFAAKGHSTLVTGTSEVLKQRRLWLSIRG